MKKIIFVLLLVLNLKSFSQQEKLQAIKKTLLIERPELDLNNKLILISVWSVNEQESRNMNKEISRTLKVYEKAKLKGGRRGICGVIVSTDNDASMEKIVSEKDGFSNLTICDALNGKVDYAFKRNILIDDQGVMVAKDLNEKEVYSFIQSQLTR